MQAKLQKSTQAHPGSVEHSWYQLSAENRILGRLATEISRVLMGKHRADYTAHVDTGDFVIVTNAEKVRLTGRKAETKQYDYYTYHAGGHKYVSFADMIKNKPEKVIIEAVRRMLPKNKLGRRMLSKLKLYPGAEHPHQAQQPETRELGRKVSKK